MNNGSIAIRYSRALLEEAQAQFIDRDVYDYLGVLYHNMKAAPELQRVLLSPRIAKEKKYQLLVTASGVNANVWTKEGTAPHTESYDKTLYTRFLQILLDHKREDVLRLIILVYRDLYRERHQIDHVIFESAMEISDALKEKVATKVHARTGREVELECRVKPDLIGGFCLRIGDMRYDYSFKTRLANIRKKLWNK